ncbi:CMP-N-acetylneuraminate-poly-alpha-2,8-sialyltransferase-like [Anneissia japonica]|uniref:CMP-N-acetylneuraminate-poly-alpha-2, 8-sialyltransferase-like n=1 Tax=Anneissia japonica TaxID=1529436 RepID=UPI0014258A04|nr:CMP-N-acetylneuraminate-poly-alpha-2,8-sialyltransferase-like [Anneissia japonica]
MSLLNGKLFSKNTSKQKMLNQLFGALILGVISLGIFCSSMHLRTYPPKIKQKIKMQKPSRTHLHKSAHITQNKWGSINSTKFLDYTKNKRCFFLCDTEDNNNCFDAEETVLVYKNDVWPRKMRFMQEIRPRLNQRTYLEEEQYGTLDGVHCNISIYYPELRTLHQSKTCAIVGASGQLINSGCGPQIDAHDFVIRANLAPIMNYTKDVGNKVNLTGINFNKLETIFKNLVDKTSDDPEHVDMVENIRYLNDSVLWFTKATTARHAAEKLKVIASILKTGYKLPIQMAYIMRSSSVERRFHLKKGVYASTGMNIFAFARTFCQNITLYGFYPFDENHHRTPIWRHYFENATFNFQSQQHDMVHEFTKLSAMHLRGEVTMVTDKCSMNEKDQTRHIHVPKSFNKTLLARELQLTVGKEEMKSLMEKYVN